MIIAVDAMGGDQGPVTTVPAVVAFLKRHPDVRICLYGDARELSIAGDCDGRLRVIDCHQRLDADERPAQALRHKRESGLWYALEAVGQGNASACVSGGDTGSLMAMAIATIGMLPGLVRPAICTQLPTAPGGQVGLLDLGANVDCSAELLHQFARMGAARLLTTGQGMPPRVALLNIGAEAGKGNRAVKAAAALLEADETLHYIGFVEADQVLLGQADLVVCDGFVGNVALKSIEGVARLLLARLRQSAGKSPWRRWLLRPPLRSALSFLDPAQYNGASLLGLRGVVVKSHGAADVAGFGHALLAAHTEAQGRLPERVAARLAGRC